MWLSGPRKITYSVACASKTYPAGSPTAVATVRSSVCQVATGLVTVVGCRSHASCVTSNHRRGIDDADGVPGEQRVAGLRPVDSCGDLDAELLGQPGKRAVAAQRDAVVLVAVGVETGAEPPGSAVGRPVGDTLVSPVTPDGE